jgi:endo-alpha-1,4-polygalactosaminidase (GH114 family)
MMSEEIIVIIDQNGEPALEVNGVKGKTCQDFSAALEKALGDTTTDTPTREFYERERNTVRNSAKR